MARRAGFIILVLTVVAGIGGRLTTAALDVQLHEPFQGYQGSHIDLTVEAGASATAIAGRLERAGVIRSARLLTGWLWWKDRSRSIHVGEYRFNEPLSVVEVADVLSEGRVVMHPLTVPEGSTRWQVAEAIARAGFGEVETVLEATLDVTLIEDLDAAADSLEGYLFPETYLAPRGLSAQALVARMVGAFREHWTPQRRARAEELGLSLREVVTLASIIEAETPVGDERPLVSGVFHNRLRRGMLLQTDPTVIYAARLAGRADRTIRRSDLQRDSPYNTYLYPGLPIGPIGSPRIESIDAALYPAQTEYLYFVSRNDGTHAFSRTLAEHNRFVQQYQRQP